MLQLVKLSFVYHTEPSTNGNGAMGRGCEANFALATRSLHKRRLPKNFRAAHLAGHSLQEQRDLRFHETDFHTALSPPFPGVPFSGRWKKAQRSSPDVG